MLRIADLGGLKKKKRLQRLYLDFYSTKNISNLFIKTVLFIVVCVWVVLNFSSCIKEKLPSIHVINSASTNFDYFLVIPNFRGGKTYRDNDCFGWKENCYLFEIYTHNVSIKNRALLYETIKRNTTIPRTDSYITTNIIEGYPGRFDFDRVVRQWNQFQDYFVILQYVEENLCEKDKVFILLEDDITFCDSFDYEIETILKWIKKNPDVEKIRLGVGLTGELLSCNKLSKTTTKLRWMRDHQGNEHHYIEHAIDMAIDFENNENNYVYNKNLMIHPRKASSTISSNAKKLAIRDNEGIRKCNSMIHWTGAPDFSECDGYLMAPCPASVPLVNPIQHDTEFSTVVSNITILLGNLHDNCENTCKGISKRCDDEFQHHSNSPEVARTLITQVGKKFEIKYESNIRFAPAYDNEKNTLILMTPGTLFHCDRNPWRSANLPYSHLQRICTCV